jgi:type I restriction enzyme S subunit
MIKESIENTNLPTGWEIKTLGEVCEINPKKSELNNFPANHLVSFLPMKDLGIAQNQINPITVKQLSEVKGSYTYFKNNDVLLAKVTPCFENGKLGIAKNLKNEIGFGSSEYIVFRPKNEILSEYLFYILSSSKFRNRGKELMYGAVGLKRLSKDYVKNFVAPFPKLPQQKQIVAILDKAFAAIDTAKANAEQNLQNAKELFESYSQNIFENDKENWNEKSIGEVCSLFQGLAINAKTKHFLVDKSTLPLLRIKDLRKNTAEQYINDEKYPQSALVNKEDLIYTRTGNSLGLVFRGRYGILHNNSFKIVPKELLTRDYLFIWLKNPNFKSKIFSLASKAAQPDITHKNFKLQKIKIPPIKEQQQIVKKINNVSAETKKLEAIYTQKIADLEEMKKSVLQKAFSGQLNTIN